MVRPLWRAPVPGVKSTEGCNPGAPGTVMTLYTGTMTTRFLLRPTRSYLTVPSILAKRV